MSNKSKTSEYNKTYREQNPEKFKEAQKKYREKVKDTPEFKEKNKVRAKKKRDADPDYNLKMRASRYNITLKDVKELLSREECEICGDKLTDSQKCIDHDHETGLVRGILCAPCNRALGGFKDDPELLMKAANYLAYLK